MIYTIKHNGKYIAPDCKFTVTDINLCRFYTNKIHAKKAYKKKDGYSVVRVKVHYRNSTTCPWVVLRDKTNGAFIGSHDIDYTHDLYAAWWCADRTCIQQALQQYPNVAIQLLLLEEGEEI